jgi:hypothetical protein
VFAVGPAFGPLQWINQSLRNIASVAGNGASQLEEIGLYLSRVSKRAAEQLLGHKAVWGDLDLLLSTSLGFANLQKFSLCVSFDAKFSGKLDVIASAKRASSSGATYFQVPHTPNDHPYQLHEATKPVI